MLVGAKNKLIIPVVYKGGVKVMEVLLAEVLVIPVLPASVQDNVLLMAGSTLPVTHTHVPFTLLTVPAHAVAQAEEGKPPPLCIIAAVTSKVNALALPGCKLEMTLTSGAVYSTAV